MSEQLKFTDAQKQAWAAEYCKGATTDQLTLFFSECERRGLIPGTHVVFQLRNSKEWNEQLHQQVEVKKVTLITSINALRLIAERTGKFDGYGPVTYFYNDDNGEPTVEKKIPLNKTPHAVTVELYRKGWRGSVLGVARFDAYAQKKNDGTYTQIWKTRQPEQLTKCAEAHGLRMVAPEECENIYIHEEMDQAKDEKQDSTSSTTAVVQPPAPITAPPVNQAPAAAAPLPPKPMTTTLAPPIPLAVPPPPPIGPAVVPPAPVEPVAVTAARVNAMMEQAKTDHMAKVNEQLANEAADLTREERKELKGAIERDPDPKPAPIVETIPASQVPPGTPMIPPPPAPPQPAALPTPTAAAPAAPSTGKPSKAEHEAFMARSKKLVRDVMEGKAKLAKAGDYLKSYILKKSGMAKLSDVTAVQWNEILSKLESLAADPAKLVAEVQS